MNRVLAFIKKDKLRYFILPFILFLFVLVLYSLTLPNVNTGYADSDEFSVAAKVLGVPHPPGYPLYTMLAALFGRLPLPLTFAGRINFLSVILHALTVVLIYFSGLVLLSRFVKDRFIAGVGAFFGSLSLAVMFSFWFYGIFAEVFPLNNFLIALTVLLLLIWSTKYANFKLKKNKTAKDPFEKILITAAFVFGLTLSNQQASLLIIPMIVVWVFLTRPKTIIDWLLLLKTAVAFVLGMLGPYIYVLIASRHLPAINWENPQDFNGVYRLVTRRIYAEAAPNGMAYTAYQFSFSQILKGLNSYGSYMVLNYGWLWMITGGVGFIYLALQKQFKTLTFLFLGIVGGGLFFAIYAPLTTASNHPYFHVVLGIYQRFFLLSPLFFSLFITMGVVALLQLFKKISPKLLFIPIAAFILMTVLSTVSDFKEIKRNDFNLGHSFAKTLLDSLPPKTILVCFSEHTCFTANYLQQVEGVRPDVTLIAADYSQMPIEEIRVKYPGLIKTTANRTSPRRSIILNRDLIRWQIDKRPIYIAGVATDTTVLSAMGLDGDPFYLIPEGCAMRVSKSFSIPQKPNTCLPVENEYLKSYTTDRAPIAYMFSGYLLYQRYFNGLLYAERLCNSAALSEFRRGMIIYPRYSDLQKLIDSMKKVPENPNCLGTTQQVTLPAVLQKVKDSEKKKDWQSALYYQGEASLIAPKDSAIRFKLADMYIAIGAYDNALIEYSDLRALYPNNQEAYQDYYKVKEAIDLDLQMSP